MALAGFISLAVDQVNIVNIVNKVNRVDRVNGVDSLTLVNGTPRNDTNFLF